MSTPAERLAHSALFGRLNEPQRAQLAGLLSYQQFGGKSLIFKEGEPGDSMYFIESGAVTFYTLDATGNEKIFRTLGDGAFFGEVSLLTDKTRSAYARADTEVFAWRLPDEKFDAFLSACPELAPVMLREMALRLRTSGEMLHHTITPGIAKEIEADRTPVEKNVQAIVRGMGTAAFLALNVLAIGAWIVANLIMKPPWDAPPFGYLALFVSTEALLVALLILAKQNRDEKDSDIRTNRILKNTTATEEELRELRRAIRGLSALVMQPVKPPSKQPERNL